jgi:tetratricopeptide (TPR) repeat protein
MVLIVGCAAPEERAADHLAKARDHFAANELAAASVEVKNALQVDPALVDAHYLQAELFERAHNWNAYRESLRRVVDLAPRHFDAQVKLGTFEALSGSLDEADAAARMALDVRPDDAVANTLMGAVRLQQRNVVGAQTFAARALAADPYNSDAIALQVSIDLEIGAFDHAAELLEKGIEATPDDGLLRMQQVRVEDARGHREGVVAAFRALIEQQPRRVEYYEALASYYSRTGRADAAERVLREAIGEVDDRTAAKLALASFLADRDPRGAAAQLEEFIANEHRNATPLKLGLAHLYVRQGRIDSAESLYRAIIDDDDDDDDARFARNRLAELEIERRRLDEAARYIDETLAQDAGNTDALTLRASVQLSRRQIDDAVATLREVLRDAPESARALDLLADAYLAQGAEELAQSTLVKVLEADPRDTIATHKLAALLMKRQQFTEADALLSRAFERDADLTTAGMLVRAKLASQQWDDAKAVVARVAPGDPSAAAATYIDGLQLQAAGHYRSSTRQFEKVLDFEPSSAAAIKAIARNFRLMDADEEARRYFEALIARKEDVREAYLALAALHAAKQRWPEAERVLRSAIERNEDWISPFRALAAAQIAQGHLDAALKTQRRIVQHWPDDIQARLYVAGIVETQGKRDEATELYREVIALDPANDVAANNLAALLIQSPYDPERLDEAFELARRFESTRVPEFADTLGWLYVLRGDFPKGIALLQRAAAAAPESPEIEFHLGTAYLKSRDAARAKTHLEKSLALAEAGAAHPSATEAKELLRGL